MIHRLLLLSSIALATSGCEKAAHTVVTIHDPLSIAANATQIATTIDGEPRTVRDRGVKAFPLSLVISSSTRREVVAVFEAVDSVGAVVARGRTRLSLSPDGGNAVVQLGHACERPEATGAICSVLSDDGALDGLCTSDGCVQPGCGDGYVDRSDNSVNPFGEQCDTGGANDDTLPDACRTTCTPAGCGDNVADSGESCDNGSQCEDGTPCVRNSDCVGLGDGRCIARAGDGCDGSCAQETGWYCDTSAQPSLCVTQCGDHITAGAEGCDDGGESSTCDSDCTPAVCGDAHVNATALEACDAPLDDAPCSGCCRTSCTLQRCDDGVLDPAEYCEPSLTLPEGLCSPVICDLQAYKIDSASYGSFSSINMDAAPDGTIAFTYSSVESDDCGAYFSSNVVIARPDDSFIYRYPAGIYGDVVWLTNDRFVTAGVPDMSCGRSSPGVFAYLHDATGLQLSVLTVTTEGDRCSSVSLARLTNTTFVAVWTDDGSGGRVLLRRIDVDGPPIDASPIVVASGASLGPTSVLADDAGNLFVNWVSNGNLMGRRFSAAGTPIGESATLETGGVGDVRTSRIDGESYVVAFRTGPSRTVSARPYNFSTSEADYGVAGEAVVLATATTLAILGDVACRSDGTCAYSYTIDGVGWLEARVLGAAPTLGPASLFTPALEGVEAGAIAWRGADIVSRSGVVKQNVYDSDIFIDLR